MKKIIPNILIGSTLLFLVSCSSISQKEFVSELSVQTTSSLNAEIEVDFNKVLTGESKSQVLFSVIQLEGPSMFADGYGDGFSSAGKNKSAAVYNAMENSDADVLVAPKYIVKSKGNPFITTVEVSVTGYAGYIKSIK